MRALLVGVGAAGNKAVVDAIERGVFDVEDTLIVNTTSKDFPSEYTGKKIMLTDGNTGCGKERSIAKTYAMEAMSAGKFSDINTDGYESVIVVTSVEGGTGSGSSPIIGKYFNQVCNKNVHIIAFTGFEEDVRGISNTVEFFKEIDPNFIVQTISNASFKKLAGGNKLKAEELANKEMSNRLRVLIGKDFIPGKQNIDDTDISKLSNTKGYMTVEKKYFDKPLETVDDFEKLVKNMIYNSATINSKNPAAIRFGVILNVSPASEDAVDSDFATLRKEYGNPFEFFLQQQWDGEREYIAYIASGMKFPLSEIEATFERYKESVAKVNKNGDEFYTKRDEFQAYADDSQFNIITHTGPKMSVADFLNSNQ